MSRISTDTFRICGNNCIPNKTLKFALVSDLHGREYGEVIDILLENKPDYILMPGDIFERLDGKHGEKNKNSFEFMKKAGEISRVIYSFGNHENGGIGSWKPGMKKKVIPKFFSAEEIEKIKDTGATLLDDSYIDIDGIRFGGLSSGLINKDNLPNTEWLDGFSSYKGTKILLCHHPEYYPKYLKELDVDLIVSGHAHGGQWRFFGRGVFAPGQGLFPKYTSGVYDGRVVVSRGLYDGGTIPRIFNKRQIIFIELDKK